MKKMGDFAAPYVKSNWDWNITSLVLQNAVRKLSRKPIHRFQKDIQEVMNSVADIPDSEEMGKLQKQYENHYKKSKLPSQLLGILLCAHSLQDETTLQKYLPEADQCFADNPTVLNLMGIIHFELEEIDRAIDFFGKSLAFNEKSIDTRRNLAESLIMKEDYKKGILEFMEVIKQNPKDIPALLRMAQFHLETERITEAEEFITKILSLDPNNKMALELKTMLHGKN
jgi:tetratricopeptide (TPR) repeat protein